MTNNAAQAASGFRGNQMTSTFYPATNTSAGAHTTIGANTRAFSGGTFGVYARDSRHAARLNELFGALLEKARREHRGPEWPNGYNVEVIHHVDFDSMKFKYKIRTITPVKIGTQLSLLYDTEGFAVPIIAQDEMEAMKLTMQIMDKYAEEYNGNI